MRWVGSVVSAPLLLQRLREREAMQGMKVKNERLERLCRALQSERTELDRKLKVRVGLSGNGVCSLSLFPAGCQAKLRGREGKGEESRG